MEYKSLYTSSDDPQFEDGEIVEVDTFYFGGNINYAKYVEGVVIGQGKVGYSSSTYWIVDFGNTNYTPGAKTRILRANYRAALVSPGAIVKREDDLSQLAINIENKVLKIESVLDEMAKDLEQLKKIK